MDDDLKLTIAEFLENLGNLRDLGYGGAGGAWATPGLGQYGVWLMIAAAVLGLIGKAAGGYRVRLMARLARPVANGL